LTILLINQHTLRIKNVVVRDRFLDPGCFCIAHYISFRLPGPMISLPSTLHQC